MRVYNKYHKNAPHDAIYIGRGSPYGNPFIIGRDGTREEVCRKYEEMLLNNPTLIQMIKEKLKGKDLICFCYPEQCHGDILIKVANE